MENCGHLILSLKEAVQCFHTVGGRPRLWSSQSNIWVKNDNKRLSGNATVIMNSHEEISIYKDPQIFCQSPTFNRRALGYSYDFPEKPVKKDKKWSIGSLFRRKKDTKSESSSEEEQKRSFLGRRRRKSDSSKRKKPSKSLVTFDHVVVSPKGTLNYSNNNTNGYSHREDLGILSDPSGGFTSYPGRKAAQIPSPELNQLTVSGSVDSITKKSRKEVVKARAAARRTTLNHDTSSDDDSQCSSASIRVRSDESLIKPQEILLNKKSRAARTERYLKRHSRDGENPYNYLRLTKSDAEHSPLIWRCSDESNRSPSRSPIAPKSQPSYSNLSYQQNSSISGLSTVPPSHINSNRYLISNSTSNPSYKPPLSMNEYNSSTRKSVEKENNLRSISYDGNIHQVPYENNVLHVQFPISRPQSNRGYRNFSLIDTAQVNRARQPPQPPPRDPNRTVQYLENIRPNTYYFDTSNNVRSTRSFNVPYSTAQQVSLPSKSHNSFNFHPSYRSSSEQQLSNAPIQLQTTVRPSSTTPEPKPRRYTPRRYETRTNPEVFNYVTDRNPRSRKPILVQPDNNDTSRSPLNFEKQNESSTQKALDFWKQIEDTQKPSIKKSPQMFTSQTSVKTQVFLPSAVADIKDPRNDKNGAVMKPEPVLAPTLDGVLKDDMKRKSANLEEALDELEAIYNSLRLGDEDLLDRAEQREKENAEKKRQEALLDNYPGHGISRGALSDSSFCYEPFDQVDSPQRKKIVRKCKIPDTKHDDMYNRKLIKDKSATISDPQSVISSVSYLLASPVHLSGSFDDVSVKEKKRSKEPDITFDDVVYRNVKHANTTLKVAEPQPPFGIPLGPIAPAANSDYLHAVPEDIHRPAFKPRKIPDIVKDDLAYRNLRKDPNKEPVLPLFDESVNKFCSKDDNLNYLKKKRAMRTLSANVGALVSQNGAKHKSEDVENEFKTLTDIADAMEIARKVLQEKGKKITETKKAFMSDTDAYSHNNETIHEKRQKFLNSLKNYRSASPCKLSSNSVSFSRPPRGLTPDRKVKELTPIPKSQLEERTSESTNSSLDDFLNALADEAKETTERISKELRMLSEEKHKRDSLKGNQDNVSDNVLDNVVDSTELIDSAKCVEEEVVEQIDVIPRIEETANIVLSCKEDDQVKAKKNEVESDHDYENLVSDKELNVDEIEVPLRQDIAEENVANKCQSPFEEHKAALVASFQELKNDTEEIPAPVVSVLLDKEKCNKEVRDEDGKERKIASVYDNLNEETTMNDEGELKARNSVLVEACDFQTNLNSNNRNQCEPILSNHNENSEEDESSSGFHSNCSCVLYQDCNVSNNNMDSLESLKSPKLVLESCQKNQKLFRDGPGTSRGADGYELVTSRRQSSDIATNGVKGCNGNNEQNNCCHDDRGNSVWYHDPATVFLACSYGIACAHQIASIDFVAILGIILAVISFIAAVLV